MDTPILATKLYIPPPPPQGILRPRLVERLNEGWQRKLTLISAPAGFGKTTLVSEWLAGSNRQAAWLSLEEGDSDLTRFLTYLTAALRTFVPDFGERVLEALQSPYPLPIEPILTALLNEIATIPGDFVLVLDDYHLIDPRPVVASKFVGPPNSTGESNRVDGMSNSVDAAITFMLEHLPPQMHLVITTREDPQLPLARLRARHQLTELRASDLRFTAAEVNGFLKARRLNLSEEAVAALEDRTEGWIAGLQLAALALQGLSMQETPFMPGQQGVEAFIRAFAGDHRYIVDYLLEEVLQRLSETVRSFLLQTAILERLNGPLCDAVTGQVGGSARLEALERGNFFVIPLDDRRQWYRYHHLFAEVLYFHLMAEQPDQVPALHRHASEWYEQNGSPADAIRHALAGEDFERAADLIETSVPAMSQIRQEGVLLNWLKSLPHETVRARPVLSVAYAHLLLDGGEVDGVEDRLRDAEWWLNSTAEGRTRPGASPAEMCLERDRRMIVVDDEAFRRLPGAIAVARAGLALAQGDVANTVKYARRVLDLIPEDDHLNRGGVAGFLGLAAWTSGDLEEAHRAFGEGMAHLQRAGNISDVIAGAVTLADIRMAQGRPREAMRTYEQALQLVKAQGKPAMAIRGTVDLYVGLSELHREYNDLQVALQHLLKSKELGEHTGFPQNRYRWRVAMARIREAQAELDGALDLLDEADRLYVSAFSPNVRPIPAMKARVWVVQGRLEEAFDWVQKQGLSVEDIPSYLHEFEHITLARILLARYRSDRSDRSILEAMGLLDRLLTAAEEGARAGSMIEILVLQALGHQSQGDISAALLPLHRALTLAEPEGYVRTFMDEGPAMKELLLAAAAGGIMPDYTGKLLEAIHLGQQSVLAVLPALGAQLVQGTKSLPTPASPSQIEPLSQRELEILRLFKTELSGPEIAQELMIALSTVRTHTKSIFSKLDVNNRRAAVKRASELGLM